MSQAVENYKNCIGAGLAVAQHPELQEWSAQRADSYFTWCYEQLRSYRSQAEAEELAAWWLDHPRNPINAMI